MMKNLGVDIMMKIAICDDDKKIVEYVYNTIHAYLTDKNIPIIIREYYTGVDLLASKIKFDTVFLDVEMEPLNGLETGKRLKVKDIKTNIVYITNYADYSLEAFEIHPFDYITKPIKKEKLLRVLVDSIKFTKIIKEEKTYALDTVDSGKITLMLDDIYYFEVFGKKIKIVCANGEYFVSMSMKQAMKRLENEYFESPHRSFLVNLIHISYIKGYDIFFDNDSIAPIPLGQKRVPDFKKKYNEYLQSTYIQI